MRGCEDARMRGCEDVRMLTSPPNRFSSSPIASSTARTCDKPVPSYSKAGMQYQTLETLDRCGVPSRQVVLISRCLCISLSLYLVTCETSALCSVMAASFMASAWPETIRSFSVSAFLLISLFTRSFVRMRVYVIQRVVQLQAHSDCLTRNSV